jgi:TATA-box binding protein (TBP) (component of TFIID and TFIIIB)
MLADAITTTVNGFDEGDLEDEDFECTHQKIIDRFRQVEIMSKDEIRFLVEDLQTRLKRKDIFQPTIFGDEFFICNTMTTCEITKRGGKREHFDLQKLNNPEDLMCYRKDLPGNMQISFDDRTPSATFSTFGHMTLIGGKSVDEVAYCLARACHKVIHYEKKLDPGSKFSIGNVNIENRVCVCSLGRNTDLLDVCANAYKYAFDVVFQQHKFPSVYLTPNGNFSIFNKSLKVSIGPSGGVNILGFRNNIEVTLLSLVLSEIIKPCLRAPCAKRVFTVEDHKRKLQRKRAKNEKWIKKTTMYKKIKETTTE